MGSLHFFICTTYAPVGFLGSLLNDPQAFRDAGEFHSAIVENHQHVSMGTEIWVLRTGKLTTRLLNHHGRTMGKASQGVERQRTEYGMCWVGLEGESEVTGEWKEHENPTSG